MTLATMTLGTMQDVVVVGAGGSGIPMAVRLAERGARVVLVESGPHALDTVPTHLVPGAQPGHSGTWSHPVQLRAGRDWHLQRGQRLGGSTGVNGGYFIRARRGDFDDWSRAGGERWTYDAVLPYLRRLEHDLQFGDSPVHGTDGPMPVERVEAHRLALDLTERAVAAGIVREPDKNGQDAPGVGPVPTNTRNGQRISTAVAYLASGTPEGLEIRTDVHVTRVRIADGRAVGVETTSGFIPAGQVVLCAGAIGSAHLLLLSGVGPAADLAALGIATLVDLPVGEGLSDHPQVVLEAPHLAGGPDPVSWLGAAVHLDLPGATDASRETIEVLQSLLPMGALVAGNRGPATTSLVVSDLTPVRRGRLSLVSPHAHVAPRVDLAYLGTPADRDRLRWGVRRASALLELPEADDTTLDTWIADHLGTSVHTCGTAPMGTVTDGAGRVLGLEGLRVADTSILPTAPTRGPANTAVLVGELLADLVT